MSFSHDTFLSPATWRYGSPEMRQVFSESRRRLLMRRVWLALATAQHAAGLVTREQLDDLGRNAERIDIARAEEIERETRHDVMAEIRCFAEQCPTGGGIIHLGATSADINDNVNALRLREAMRLLTARLEQLLAALADKIDQFAHLPVMAYTHIQPAEPTTLGYRFAVYAQDLLENWRELRRCAAELRGKGFKGAVGTQASYHELLGGDLERTGELERRAMAELELPAFPIATQTYTRQQDLRVMQQLAGLAASLHKFAMDFRVLQSPAFGEWAEPFGRNQVGSSAMPFKRNPINTENICSLARLVASYPGVMWDNASQAILERSLDDSANRRFVFPEAFLASDEMLSKALRVVGEMHCDQQAMQRNLALYGPFAATERVLMALASRGASRQEGHEWLRRNSLQAWEHMRHNSGPNPLGQLLEADPDISRLLPPEQIRELMRFEAHTGTAPARAQELAREIRRQLPS